MDLFVVGQRCLSEPEPELGLGIITSVDRYQVGVDFPTSGEKRIYATGASVLKRVKFRVGETVLTKDEEKLTIEEVVEADGLLIYVGGGFRVSEDEISDITNFSLPHERLMKGKVDSGEVFELRFKTLQAQVNSRQSSVRGYLGGRVDLIPHQIYILNEVATRQIPRVLLADEVGLGKTIEACLILQRLLAVGKVSRAIILVPESLVHQWFVELLRRFNLWFSIFDEERCQSVEHGDPGANPFLDEQLVLCSVSFLTGSEIRQKQAIEGEWDMVVVDEAHHLEWAPDKVSDDYVLVDELALRSPGLLLLTATPTQLGLPGHFARLRLLDPARYDDFDSFLKEAEDFGVIAEIAGKIIDDKVLNKTDQKHLKRIFDKDTEGLEGHLLALASKDAGAKDELLTALLDQHGTGRVMFRNTRSNMTGFPKRKFIPELIDEDNKTLLNRIRRELEAEENDHEDDIRYSFKEDPRIDWLADFLKSNRDQKLLLICKSQRKVLALEAALQEKISAKVGLFHEGLALVKRDRNAAWFAEEDGAQLLICSEIGSEGRNFQFAHHLVLFDLPLNPGLLEQRIGRLDRIGQTETIQIHVPFVKGSCQEFLADWYHRGLNSIETSLHGGTEFQDRFRKRVLEMALEYDAASMVVPGNPWDKLVEETIVFREQLQEKLRKGRDRLLELNSFDKNVAGKIIERIREVDSDSSFREGLCDIFDHYGVRLHEHDEGDIFLDPSHAYIEAYPSIPQEGMMATFDRARAITREDMAFISPDHPIYWDSMDLLVNSKAGTTALGLIEANTSNILLEAIFVCEAVADSKWHVEQYLAPTPIRMLVDIRGNDLSDDRTHEAITAEAEDGNIYRFLEMPGFNEGLLKAMIEGATELAEAEAEALKAKAGTTAHAMLSAAYRRLVDLRKINDHVRLDEIDHARKQLKKTLNAIAHARLRLDSIRLIVEGATESLL
ncbi:MAG: RNA polymerase-associated protein RapA [Verrucomicrobia bacterium]|nr:RNA polymerase-associated protein RapA [Verrucomicrobiota bacterium]